MPRIPLAADTVQLLANYLLQQAEPALAPRYLSPAQHPLLPLPDRADDSGAVAKVNRNYLTYCASCHGPEGRGDGFNAAFLPVKPTAHAEAKHMATRADDTLFDGIHSGGAILNKSHLMPPWGQILTPDEIKNLVKHMRTLCGCERPSWSRDN